MLNTKVAVAAVMPRHGQFESLDGDWWLEVCDSALARVHDAAPRQHGVQVGPLPASLRSVGRVWRKCLMYEQGRSA